MLQVLKNKSNSIVKLGNNITFPKKLKGTVIEKWANYWKNLCIDYHQMLQDLRTDIQDEPKKAILWTSGLMATYLLSKNNPSEADYKDFLKTINNEVILINENCINPKSINHLRYIDRCYNEDVIHYKSFGIASVMYVTDYNKECSLYKTQCSYLQPTYFNMFSKIVDVGFAGKWWNLFIKTTNYDVN